MTRRVRGRWAAVLPLLLLGGCSFSRTDAPAGGTTSPLENVVPPPSPFRGETRIELVQNSIRVPTRLPDIDGDRMFVLDSGAPMTIDPRLVEELALPTEARTTLAGPDGHDAPADVVVLPRVETAGLAFSDVGAVVDWVEPPDPVACLSRDGLLGASLLRAGVWQIDFHARRLVVSSDPDELPGTEYAMRLPFHRADAAGSPRIRADLGSSADASVLIDLGFNGGIALPLRVYEAAGGRVDARTPAEQGHATATVLAAERSTLYVGRLPEVRIGALRLPDFPVVTGDHVSDLHVGVAFLRHFRVTIDWRNDELYLQRRDPEAALYDDYTSYGFTPDLQDGQLRVGALWRDAAAARAGLRLDDRIVAIDETDTTTPSFATFCRLLGELSLYGSRRDAVAVTVERGSTRSTVRLRRTPLLPDRDEPPPR